MTKAVGFKGIILDLCKRHALFLLIAVIVLTIASFIEACSVVSFAPMIDLLINPDLSKASDVTLKVVAWMERINLPITLISVMIFIITIMIIRGAFTILANFIMTKVHFRLVKNIIFDVFGAFIGARWQFFVLNSYGVIGNTLLRETEKVGLAFEAVAKIFSILMRIIFYVSIAFLISWKLSLIVLLLTGAVLIPFLLLGRLTYKIGKIHTQAGNDFQGVIAETFNAAKLVLSFGNQDKVVSRLKEKIPPYITSAIQFIMIRLASPLVFEPVGIAIVLFAIYLGAIHYSLSVPTLLIVLYALRMGGNLAFQIAYYNNDLQNIAPALEQIYRLKHEAEIMKQPSGTQKFYGFKRDICIKDMSFSYPNHKSLFNNINLVIPKGKMVALVGKSGSGKTTLIDILIGLYEPEQGQVLIDGIPLSEIDSLTWRHKLGVVSQEPFLFNFSIRDNLLWGVREEIKEKDIRKACSKANALEFIDKLPKGLDTLIGERGVRLSGGQRQRIAIARAVLRDPEVLILDEATSALDSHSEILIQKSIDDISQDTTVIVIAHRLSTIKSADKIYVLEEGSIIESGSFDELIKIKGGEFLKAVELQTLNYSHDNTKEGSNE